MIDIDDEDEVDVAVSIRDAYKSFGSKKKPTRVLIDFNMTVEKGTIYGLLGASGCGKTTLLSMIVGMRKLDTGEINIFGGKPKRENGIPGKRVGYMPQEIALCSEFTIKETMMYFGWIAGMYTAAIKKRLTFLLKFLDLPSENRLVKNLSGGQQRRVSFAVALLHDPELLILDEPTVGVDPLLRQNIWNHLVHIVKTQRKTVIITTHYIEETRQAHKIGLMRAGQLLAEQSPSILLTMYRCDGLEDVFLKLCVEQQEKLAGDNVSNNLSLSRLAFTKKEREHSKLFGIIRRSKVVAEEEADEESVTSENMTSRFTKIKSQRWVGWSQFTTCGKMRALLAKNFLRLFRNVGLLGFIFIIPIIQVILFCLAIGHEPVGLNLAVVNMELNSSEKCHFTKGCTQKLLSCRYLSYLEDYEIKYHKDFGSAMDEVKRGSSWGVLYFNKEYSSALLTRTQNPQAINEKVLNNSEIHVNLDMSNSQIGLINSRDLQEAYHKFMMKFLKDCGSNPRLGDIPVTFGNPIYGKKNPTFTDFVAPGVIVTIIFFLALTLTSTALIIEKTEGFLDRSFVAGVTLREILLASVISQFVLMCCQSALVLIFMFSVFDVTNYGSIFLVMLLTIMQGFCGMCFGFFISAVCDLERTAIQVSLGSFYPSLLLSGVLWPIEGMPNILRKFSIGLPLTLATSSLRSILSRGWGLNEFDVYIGFVATLSWIFFFLLITMISFRIKRY